MNHHCVPDFGMDDEFSNPPSSSTFSRHKADEDNIQELLWQDGHVIIHSSQPHRSHHKSPSSKTPRDPPPPQPPPQSAEHNQLYMAEDEMAAWLHYPLEDLYTDLLYPTTAPPPPPPPAPPVSQSSAVAREPELRLTQPRPPAAPPSAPQRNFPLFSRMSGRGIQPASSRASTVVDSSDTPEPAVAAPPAPLSLPPPSVATSVGEVSPATIREGSAYGGDGGNGAKLNSGGSGDMTVTSSASASGSGTGTGGSGGTTTIATATATGIGGGEGVKKREVGDRKRKGRETDDAAATITECQTERCATCKKPLPRRHE